MALIDISPTISTRLAVWPGDVAYTRDVALDMETGDNLTLSAVRATVHLGAHADAPSHYARRAEGIHQRSLERYYGPAQVMAVSIPRGARVRPEHLPDPIRAERLLLRTGSYPDPERFNTDFNSLSPALVAFAYDRGVRLIGIDTPSIDRFDDRALLSHGAVAARDMAVLEGLVLDHVEPGLYTLIALPLKLEGADASPVRAALAPR